MSYKQTVAELDVVLFHDVCFISSNNKKKKGFFFLCFSYLQISSSRTLLEGGRAEGGAAAGAGVCGGGNNRSGNKSSGGAGSGGGVSVDVLPLTHTSHSSLRRVTPPFFLNHFEVRCEAPIKLSSRL